MAYSLNGAYVRSDPSTTRNSSIEIVVNDASFTIVLRRVVCIRLPFDLAHTPACGRFREAPAHATKDDAQGTIPTQPAARPEVQGKAAGIVSVPAVPRGIRVSESRKAT